MATVTSGLKINKCFLDTLRTDLGYEPFTDEAPYNELRVRYLHYDYPGAHAEDECRIIIDDERALASDHDPAGFRRCPAVLCWPIPGWEETHVPPPFGP